MARTTKYDTHIKPNFDTIRWLIKGGATEKDVYNALDVGKNIWIAAKKEKKEFKELLENVEAEKIREAVKDLRSTLKNRPELDDLVGRMVKAMGEEPSVGIIKEVMYCLYPEMDPYLQIKKYDAETRRMNVEKGDSNEELIKALGRMFNGVPSNI